MGGSLLGGQRYIESNLSFYTSGMLRPTQNSPRDAQFSASRLGRRPEAASYTLVSRKHETSWQGIGSNDVHYSKTLTLRRCSFNFLPVILVLFGDILLIYPKSSSKDGWTFQSSRKHYYGSRAAHQIVYSAKLSGFSLTLWDEREMGF